MEQRMNLVFLLLLTLGLSLAVNGESLKGKSVQLGVPPDANSAVFLNIVQKGGGSFPCSKILEQILYDFKGILAT